MSVNSNDSVHGQGHNLAGDPNSSGGGPASGVGQARSELLVIETGGRLLGVFTEDVNGIVAGKVPTPLPRAPVSVLGVIAFRGRMLTVIDPLLLLGGSSRIATPGIVVALGGEEQLAIAADSSRGAIDICSGDIELPEQGTESEIVLGTLQRGGGRISILDVPKLFGATMQQQERRRRRF